MKNYYRLLNYELMVLFRPLILLCIGIIISPLPLLNASMQDYTNMHDRFETVYHSSGSIVVFGIYFVALCGVCIKSIYLNYWGSKSIYTLMTLPIKREIIYFTKLTAFFICFMILITAQFISIFIDYLIFTPTIVRYIDGQPYFEEMHNGLFLAIIRSDFLRILFPLSIEGFISSVAILITIVSGLYYGVLCERSRRFLGFFPVIVSIIIIIYTITQRIDMNSSTYITSLILLSLSTFFIWHGMKLVKRSAII